MKRKTVSGIMLTVLSVSILTLAFNIQMVTQASPASDWLSGWSYRKSHVINPASGAGTNYQIMIKAHYDSGTDSGEDVYLNTHSRTDFGDVRFTDDDGTTELDYWMEEKVDSDYAIFWVEIGDDLSSQSQTIHVYYGNSGVTTTSNGENTFEEFTDFLGTSLPSDWEVKDVDTGSHSVSDSILQVNTSTRSYGVWSHYVVGTTGTFPTDRGIRAKIQTYNPDNMRKYVHVAFSQEDDLDTVYGGEFYSHNASVDFIEGRYGDTSEYHRFWTWKDGNREYANVSDHTGTWHTIDILRTAGKAVFIKDGTTEATHTTHVPTNSLPLLVYVSEGWGGSSPALWIKVDWIFIRKHVDPEPAHGSWGVEEPAPGMATEVVYPSDDSWVDKAERDENYGYNNGLAVTTTTVDEKDRRTFLKFSLSFIPSPENIDSVELFLFRDDYYPPGWGPVGNVEAMEVSDDSWTEETITWNNQPTYGNPLDVVSVFDVNQWYSWDVTPFILDELAGDEVASVCLKAENEDGGSTYRYSVFYSKEYDGFDPHLLVTYELPTTYVKVYVDQPLGYIPGVPVGDTITVDIMINTTGFVDAGTPSIVGWSLRLQVDPAVISINTTVGPGFPPPPPDATVIGSKVGYVMYDYDALVSRPGDPSLLSSPANATTGYWDEITEIYVPLGTTGFGDYMTNTYYGGPAPLVTINLTSKSETAYSLIDLLDVAWLDGTNTWHPVNEVIDGHYNSPPASDLGIEGILLPYISPVPLIYPTPDPGFFYKINATVTNLGTSDAGSFNVSFSVHLNETEVPEYAWKKTISGLAQGVNETVWFDFMPENYGNYTLVIEADCDNDVAELDETNNVKTAWVIGTIRGDVDGDGDVDRYDFGYFATVYGRRFEQPPYDPADFDYDGDVDRYDFSALATNYGKTAV